MPQDKPVSPRSSRTKPAQLNQSESFLIIIILGIVVTLILSAVSIGQLEKRQQKIMDVYNDHTAEMCAIISRIDSLQRCDSTLTAKDAEQLTSRLESIVAEARSIDKKDAVVHLLELEFNKIQSEYEELSIWSGILGVIFLVFSFFSLYKGDDVIKQASETLTEIQDIRDSVADKSDDLDKTVKEKIEELSTKISPLEEKLKDLTTSISNKKITIEILEKQISGIAKSANVFQQTMDQRMTEFNTSFDNLKKRLNENHETDLQKVSDAVLAQLQNTFDSKFNDINSRLADIEIKITDADDILDEKLSHEEELQNSDSDIDSEDNNALESDEKDIEDGNA